jgi:hypothetical protein
MEKNIAQINAALEKIVVKKYYDFQTLDEKTQASVNASLKSVPKGIDLPEGETIIGFLEDGLWESEANHFVVFCSDGLRWHSKGCVKINGKVIEHGFLPYSNFYLFLPKCTSSGFVLYNRDLDSSKDIVYEFSFLLTLDVEFEKNSHVLNEFWEIIHSNYPHQQLADRSINVEELVAFIGDNVDTYIGCAKQFSRLARKSVLGIFPSANHILLGPLVIISRKMYILGLLAIITFYSTYSCTFNNLAGIEGVEGMGVWFMATVCAYLTMIPFGILNPFFYYSKYRRVIKKTSHITDNERRLEVIKSNGGSNPLLGFLGMVIIVLLCLFF